jgi:hypothetical protein
LNESYVRLLNRMRPIHETDKGLHYALRWHVRTAPSSSS